MRLCLDGKYIRLYDADVKRVTLKNTMPIECEIYTPVLSLGGWRSGTLYGIMVTPSENTSGFLDIGYETGLGAYSKSVSVGSSIDFNCLDFGNFGFNSRLKQTIKFKCLERNVDHIRVWVRSISGADFGIDKVALIYKGEKNE